MVGIGLWVWDPQEPHQPTLLFAGNRIELLGVRVSWHQASAFVMAAIVAVGLRVLLHRTRTGLDMRASVDSRPSLSSTAPGPTGPPASPGPSAARSPRWPGSSSPRRSARCPT